jgi:hypothetical protein
MSKSEKRSAAALPEAAANGATHRDPAPMPSGGGSYIRDPETGALSCVEPPTARAETTQEQKARETAEAKARKRQASEGAASSDAATPTNRED